MVGYHNHILFPLLTMPNEQTDKTQTHKIWATKSLKKDFKLVRKKKTLPVSFIQEQEPIYNTKNTISFYNGKKY